MQGVGDRIQDIKKGEDGVKDTEVFTGYNGVLSFPVTLLPLAPLVILSVQIQVA